MRRKCNQLLAGLMAALVMVTSMPTSAYAMESVKGMTTVVTTKTDDTESGVPENVDTKTGDEEKDNSETGDGVKDDPETADPEKGDPETDNPENGSTETGDTKNDNPETGDAEASDTETGDITDTEIGDTESDELEESEIVTENAEETGVGLKKAALEAADANGTETYTINFDVVGVDQFKAYITYGVPLDEDTYYCIEKDLSVVDGKASLEVTKTAEQETAYLAIGGIRNNESYTNPYDGNVTCCKKGGQYYPLRESAYAFYDYLFNLGKIEENSDFEFRYGFNKEDCQKVIISTKENDCDNGRMDILYSANGFDDSIDAESGRATRGEMLVDVNEDGQFVFWIPKGYDWAIVNITNANVTYEDSFLKDKSGNNCLKPNEKINYAKLYENDTRGEEGELKVYHNFGTMPETIEDEVLEYTVYHRKLNTLTLQGDVLKGSGFSFYQSVDGVEWENYEYITSVTGEDGRLPIESVMSGNIIAITNVHYAAKYAIYTTPLLFSEDGVNYHEPKVENIKVSEDRPAMPAYIIEVPEEEQTIYVKSTQKTFHIYEDNPVGYSIEYLSGVDENQVYDGKSDITFKVSNVYGNELPIVDIKYTENGGWCYDNDGILDWVHHLVSLKDLNTACTVKADESGVYTIRKEALDALSDQLVRNVPLYFTPRIDCYDYQCRLADSRIKSGEIIVGKTKFASSDTSKCATVNVDWDTHNYLRCKVPAGYYVGVGKIVSDYTNIEPVLEVSGACTLDGFLPSIIETCEVLMPDPESDGLIHLAVLGRDVLTENKIFAFSGIHTTLKDLASELPEGYKWEDDSVKISTLGITPTKFRIINTEDPEDISYIWVCPYEVVIKATNVLTCVEVEDKIAKGSAIFVAPGYEIYGDLESLLLFAKANVSFDVQSVTDAIGFEMEIEEDGIYRITGLKAGKGILRTNLKCEIGGKTIAAYSKDYVIEVVDSDAKGIADIQVSLVTKNAEGQDVPVPVNEDDGVYHVDASDKLYLKNETMPYGTGKINTVKFTSSDTAIAKVGKMTGAYTELIPVTSGYAVITAKAADTLGTTRDLIVKVGPAKNDKDEVVYDNTNILLNEYAVTLNTLSSDIAGTVEVITPSGEKVRAVEAVNAKGNADANYTVSVDGNNRVTIKGTPQSKTGKIYLKVTLEDAKSSEVTIKNPVTVTVKKTVPKLNIKQTAKLDTYYEDGKAELIISVPGEKITKVSVNEDSKYDVTVKPEELGKSSVRGEISLKNNTQAAELKNTSVTVSVSLEGFAAPLEKVIKVGTMQSATALSAISGTVYKGKNNTLITRVMNKNTKSVVSLADAEEVSCNSENYEITTDTVKNELRITPKTELAKGKSEKITITVKAKEMQFAKTYTYTVKYADASSMALEIKNKSLGLYKYDGDTNDTARTVITLKGGAGADILESIQWKPASTSKTAADYAKLGIVTSYEAGVLLVNATVSDNSIKAGSYKYTFYIPKETAGTRKDISTVLTVKVADATGKKAPAVKATIKGKLDTVNRAVGVDIIPKFTNVKTDDATVTAVLTGRDAHLFEIGADGKLYLVKSANVLTKYKYQINIQYTVQREDLTFVCTTPAINISLSQTRPKVYTTKLTAFSSVREDTKEVKLSIQNAKGEQLNIEKIQVVNTNSAFTVVTDAATGIVSITHNPKAGKTKKGKSYKITFQIYPEGCANNEKPVTVTCPIKISK